MERSELIARVKEKGLETPKPAHMCATEFLEQLLASQEPKEVQPTMKSRILELGREGILSKKGIEKKMREEGFDKIRYGYIFIVLKDNKVKVPKEPKQKKVKVEEVPIIENVEENLTGE